MKRLMLSTLSLLILVISGCAQWELKEAVEFQQRNGLPNFFSKVQNKEDVTVGFIGGSITKTDGWRPKIVSMLKEHYEIDNFIDYNAAVSGTNSKYGVFRIDEHLLSKHDFDLIFVEFAVNDKNSTADDIIRSMEGIIRKIWSKNPFTDICFVYTISYKFLPDIEDGKMNLTATIHDSIASYYGIPSLFWGVEVNEQLQNDNVVWTDVISDYSSSQNDHGQFVFTYDKTHPTDFGHQVYADVLMKCFKNMDESQNNYKHTIRTPMDKENYENSQIQAPKLTNNHGMEVVDAPGEKEYLNKFLNEDTWFLISDNPDAYYSFSFIGSEIGISEMRGPSSGNFIVEIDGKKREINSFDPYCSYWREGCRFIKLSENAEHFVKIYASPDQLSLAEKRDMLNTEKRKQDLDKNPEEYEINEYIFSAILLDGDASYFYTEDITACYGDTVVWHNKEYTESGVYYDRYESSTGYDSVYQMNLQVCPTHFSIEYETIADGDSLLWEGRYITTLGKHQANYLSINGCDSIRELNLTFSGYTTGIDDGSAMELKVYPNPTSDQISLLWNEIPKSSYDITLTNANGVPIYTESHFASQTEKSIDISAYPPGMYFLTIRRWEDNHYSSFKIMKI